MSEESERVDTTKPVTIENIYLLHFSTIIFIFFCII